MKGKNGDKQINAKKEKTPTIRPHNQFKGRASSSLATEIAGISEITDAGPTSGNTLIVPSYTKDMIATQHSG